MPGLRRYAAAAVATLAAATAGEAHAAAPPAGCTPVAPPAYTAGVRRVAASGTDVWGQALLRAPGGPTLAAARGLLAPLTRALGWQARPLTPSGSYYLPLAFPFTPHGSTVFALHVADGSEILTRSVDGPSLRVYVGTGREPYGACASRLGPARLADGYLPLLETSYVDAAGVHYRQESFVGRTYGARSVVSFVRLEVDARHARRGATLRLVPSEPLGELRLRQLGAAGLTRLVVSTGSHVAPDGVSFPVRAGHRLTFYADWLHAPSRPQRYLRANAAAYAAARATVVRFWRARLAAGAAFDVPEAAVERAQLAVRAQLIACAWRYSIGNPYEELSYAESLDAAEVAAEYGYASVAHSIVRLSLQRMRIRPWRFDAFRGSHILATAALVYRLTRDRAALRAETPGLARLVDRIAARQRISGPAVGRLLPEPLSTDLENRDVDSVPGQVEAVEGLLAVARAWSATGDGEDATRARTLATSIDAALRPALARASVRLRDGSLFVPDQLAPAQAPFRRLTATRAGSYWNLVMPAALGSGWFGGPSPTTRGLLRYLLLHGSRLLGVPRTYARTVYGSAPGAGLAQVYGLGVSRFLADQDRPGQLVLGLYGMLAAGMTAGTYVSGEAVSVVPVRGAWQRAMFMPPNTGANASFLGTLRELLVHERRRPDGSVSGLDLAFSTPTAWLADGRRIAVRRAPTSLGPVSFSLVRHGRRIDGRLLLPAAAHARLRLRLPPGERLLRVVVGSRRVAVAAGGTIDLGARRGPVRVRAVVAG